MSQNSPEQGPGSNLPSPRASSAQAQSRGRGDIWTGGYLPYLRELLFCLSTSPAVIACDRAAPARLGKILGWGGVGGSVAHFVQQLGRSDVLEKAEATSQQALINASFIGYCAKNAGLLNGSTPDEWLKRQLRPVDELLKQVPDRFRFSALSGVVEGLAMLSPHQRISVHPGLEYCAELGGMLESQPLERRGRGLEAFLLGSAVMGGGESAWEVYRRGAPEVRRVVRLETLLSVYGALSKRRPGVALQRCGDEINQRLADLPAGSEALTAGWCHLGFFHLGASQSQFAGLCAARANSSGTSVPALALDLVAQSGAVTTRDVLSWSATSTDNCNRSGAVLGAALQMSFEISGQVDGQIFSAWLEWLNTSPPASDRVTIASRVLSYLALRGDRTSAAAIAERLGDFNPGVLLEDIEGEASMSPALVVPRKLSRLWFRSQAEALQGGAGLTLVPEGFFCGARLLAQAKGQGALRLETVQALLELGANLAASAGDAMAYSSLALQLDEALSADPQLLTEDSLTSASPIRSLLAKARHLVLAYHFARYEIGKPVEAYPIALLLTSPMLNSRIKFC